MSYSGVGRPRVGPCLHGAAKQPRVCSSLFSRSCCVHRTRSHRVSGAGWPAPSQPTAPYSQARGPLGAGTCTAGARRFCFCQGLSLGLICSCCAAASPVSAAPARPQPCGEGWALWLPSRGGNRGVEAGICPPSLPNPRSVPWRAHPHRHTLWIFFAS